MFDISMRPTLSFASATSRAMSMTSQGGGVGIGSTTSFMCSTMVPALETVSLSFVLVQFMSTSTWMSWIVNSCKSTGVIQPESQAATME